MVGSNINKILVCISIAMVWMGMACAQRPGFTPKQPQPITILLPVSGNLIDMLGTVKPDNLNPNPAITITPAAFGCYNIGLQTVNIKISDNTTPVTFNQPTGICIDAAGNAYIADAGNHVIRKIDPASNVTTFAGSGTVGNLDGTGTAASFDTPEGIAIDAAGNLYVTDSKSGLLRVISPAGAVTTLAGNAYYTGNDVGSGLGVSFDKPYGIAVDSHGNMFIADAGGNQIRKVTPAGLVYTFAGNKTPGFADGPGSTALFNTPAGITIDAADNLYVADTYNNRIRKITPAGFVTTIAGNSVPGRFDAVGTTANFDMPYNLTIDKNGNIYVADTQNNDIRKIDPNYSVTTIAGNDMGGNTDGYIYIKGTTQPVAQFNEPIGLAVMKNGNLLIGDVNNNEIRQLVFSSASTYTGTLGGNGTAGLVNGNLNYDALHSTTAMVTVDVKSYLKIKTVFNNATLEPCVSTMPDFIKLNSPLSYDYICNDNIAPHQEPAPGTPLTSNTTYNVQIIAENAEANYDTATFKVTTKDIVPLPVVTITPSTTGDVCPGSPVTFTAATQNTDAPAYQWTVNGASVGTNSSTFTSTFKDGDAVTCNIISGTCSAPATSAPYIVHVAPVPTVTFDKNIIIKFGKSIELDPVTTGDIVSYQWSPTDGLSSSTIANPVLTAEKTGNYKLTVTSATGCEGSGTVNVQVIGDVEVPNAFTPNSDGVNDLWEIPGLILYPNCVVSVYNRYGTRVYYSTGYAKPWNGTYKNHSLPTGTYYYIIDLKINKPKVAGPVTILK
jgi:gliding motility-associated-like protein